MKKDKCKYSVELTLREYPNNDTLESIILLGYFELTTAKEIKEISGFFHENLLLYLEKHNIIKEN